MINITNSNQLNTINSRSSGTANSSARFGGGGAIQSSQINSLERPISANYGGGVASKYLQPTVASLSRQRSPKRVNIRDRIHELEDALLEIKSISIQNGTTLQTQLEKENSRVMTTVNSQIQSLKQAIGTLADAVSDEIENLRKQMYTEIEGQLQSQTLKLEQNVSQYFNKQDNEQSKVLFEMQTLKDEVQTLQVIEYKNIEKTKQEFEEKMTGMKSDNKKLFEQLRMIIQSNSQQMSVNTKEIERVQTQIELNRNQVNNLNENYQEFMKKLLQLDKDTSTELKQIQSEMIDLKALQKDQNQFNQTLKSQIEQLTRNLDLKNQTYAQSQSEQTQTLSIKTEGIEKAIKKLKQELENSSQNLKDLLKQNYNQITQKIEISEQAKSSLETSLHRKVNSVEDLFETQRKELFASMSDLERVLSKKSDSVARAIREITQQLNITNPLLLS